MADIDNEMKMSLSVHTKIRLLLLAILLIGGGIFCLFCWMFHKLQCWTLIVLIVFMVWFALAGWVSGHSNGKVMKAISYVISVPLVVVFLSLGLVQPFITIVGTYFFVASCAFGIPALLLHGMNHVLNMGLLPETIVFIAIAFGSILCANSYKITKKIIRWTPLHNNGEHRYEEYREKLAYYLIQPSNVVYLLYLVYLVLLTIIGFIQIQYGSSLINKGYDAAILKAFLVFIAFTNMKNKAQSSDLDSHELLKLTLGLFVPNDKEWLQNRFSNKTDS
ncbi:MAG: hypothetical protein J5932_00890 [Prevotella sp.]|nr:hypothetical protein [Prevotella sp.]